MKDIDIVSQVIWMIFLMSDEDKALIRDSIHLSTEETPEVWKKLLRRNYIDFIKERRALENIYGTLWVTNGTKNKKIIKHIEDAPEGWYEGFTRKKELNSTE